MEKKNRLMYRVLGNHPTLKYINWIAISEEDMEEKKKNLESMGYEVEIEKIEDGI